MKHPDQETLSQLMDGEWQGLDVRRCVIEACRDEAQRAKWSRYHLARDAMRNESFAAATLSLAERIGAALEREPSYSNVTAIGTTTSARTELQPAAEPPVTPLVVPVAGSSPGSVEGTGERVEVRRIDAREGRVDGERVAEREQLAPRSDEPRGEGPGRLRTVAAGFGLAASVALITAFGLNAWQDGSFGDAAEAPVQVAAAPDAPTPAAPANVVATVEPTADPVADVAGDTSPRRFPGAPLPEVEYVGYTGGYWATPGTMTPRAGSERLNAFLSQHIEYSPTSEREGMLPYSRLVGYEERAPER